MAAPAERAPPAWASWPAPHEGGAYTVGIEEEVMLLDGLTWRLAHRIDSVLPRLSHSRENRFTAETHGSALEIQTGVHGRIGDAIEELGALRRELDDTLKPLSMRAAGAGTHAFAVWQEIVVSAGERYQSSTVRCATGPARADLRPPRPRRRPGPRAGDHAANRQRTELPLLFALSVPGGI